MKIKVITLALALIIAVTSFVVAFASTPKLKVNENSLISTTQINDGYYLRAFNSKIGVFEAGRNQPQQVLDVYISSLPLDAQKLIKAGIHCRDKTELLQRIEDYTS
jgi:hypothetical protein